MTALIIDIYKPNKKKTFKFIPALWYVPVKKQKYINPDGSISFIRIEGKKRQND